MSQEKEPLLTVEEEDPYDVTTPRETIRKLYESDNVLGRHSPFREDGTINITASNSFQNLAGVTERDYIVSIFVVAFDTKAGEF